MQNGSYQNHTHCGGNCWLVPAAAENLLQLAGQAEVLRTVKVHSTPRARSQQTLTHVHLNMSPQCKNVPTRTVGDNCPPDNQPILTDGRTQPRRFGWTMLYLQRKRAGFNDWIDLINLVLGGRTRHTTFKTSRNTLLLSNVYTKDKDYEEKHGKGQGIGGVSTEVWKGLLADAPLDYMCFVQCLHIRYSS